VQLHPSARRNPQVPKYVPTPGSGAALKEKELVSVKRPRRYKVLLLNDHYTTMEFVIAILEQVFAKPRKQAVKIMLQVHNAGQGVAGVYVKSVAEAKAELVHKLARDNGFPLKCAVEPDSGGDDERD